ncbi:hypothetical protein [Lapidilactobacillus wuchangensis]|uniref:hypothetical protein n=1 Tax=Lapidilactobacillus wuchangensis TaxID=2486001 RepID=UPI000F7803FD|nr:hypothetical protein [Lapidilactobacillus wuchangensis]
MSGTSFLALALLAIAIMQILNVPSLVKERLGENYKYLVGAYFGFIIFILYWGIRGDKTLLIIVTVILVIIAIMLLVKIRRSFKK